MDGAVQLVRVGPGDRAIAAAIIQIDQEAFGPGGLNEWILSPLLRHGRVYAALFGDSASATGAVEILGATRCEVPAGEEPVLARSSIVIVGSCQWLKNFDDPDHAYLYGLAVARSYRGMGIGRFLLERSMADLRSSGVSCFSLTVSPDNAVAYALYSSIGFRRSELLKAEYGPGEDRILMVLGHERGVPRPG